MEKELVKAVLSFCGGKEEGQKFDMKPLIPAFALLRFMGRSIIEMHEFAKLQGYEGGYTAFTRWLKRNVDFEAELSKHADEFKAIVTGAKPVTKPATEAASDAGHKKSPGPDVFAPRTPETEPAPSTEPSKARPSVSEPSESTDKRLSPREALEKWKNPSYEDQLKKLGLDKGKHEDENRSR